MRYKKNAKINLLNYILIFIYLLYFRNSKMKILAEIFCLFILSFLSTSYSSDVLTCPNGKFIFNITNIKKTK